jgi:hypothetical protein
MTSKTKWDGHALLLVPKEGDPNGLLEDGPCGARPPRAVWVEDLGAWRSVDWTDLDKLALVLAWDGVGVKHAEAWLPEAAKYGWRGRVVDALCGDDLDGITSFFSRWGTLTLINASGELCDDK